jgi:hypothetical protein
MYLGNRIGVLKAPFEEVWRQPSDVYYVDIAQTLRVSVVQ